MGYLELIRTLPDGLKSKVIQAARKIATEKRHKDVGSSSVFVSEQVLYLDDDTWAQAWMKVEPRKDWVNQALLAIPFGSRYRWCNSGACACMGCANYSDVTEEEHAKWVDENPREDNIPPEEVYMIDGLTEKEFDLVQDGNRIQAIKLCSRRLGCSLMEAKKVIDNLRA